MREDRLTVALGFTMLTLVILGWRPILPAFKWADSLDVVLAPGNLRAALLLGLLYMTLTMVSGTLLGWRPLRYVPGFAVIYALAWLAQVAAGHVQARYWGIEYVVFALVAGLLVGHVFGVPDWLREALRTEFYVKTGLVLLGASILFGDIARAGALGIVQALLVVTVVWFVCWWIARRLRVADEFAAILATAVSICGVSAAIAACAAVRGDKRQLSYVTSLVLVVAVPMMLLMPWAAKMLGLPDLVGGAWLGGTLDTSASVVAAGALISEPAMKAGVIVKFSQNVLIGVAAFALSCWWAVGKSTTRPSARVIWDRFPVFVLGFLVASLVASFVLSSETARGMQGVLGGLRTTWFALAFVCIGLETRLTDFLAMDGGRPALAFLLAQAVNVVWTLLIAWLLFGGVLVAVPRL